MTIEPTGPESKRIELDEWRQSLDQLLQLTHFLLYRTYYPTNQLHRHLNVGPYNQNIRPMKAIRAYDAKEMVKSSPEISELVPTS